MGFAIVLKDGEVSLTNKMPIEIPFPPRYILLDVQRAFYPWFSGASPATTEHANGMRESIIDGEHITETWEDGRLITRSFARIDQIPPGLLTVHYQWNEPEWSVPTFVVLDNAWFGYQLEIDTHAETRLDAQGE